jgi:hypothetical protein
MLKKSAGRTEFVLGCWRYCAANSVMGTPTALLTAQTQLERLYLHQLQCSAVQSLNETLTPRILTRDSLQGSKRIHLALLLLRLE